ncbi:hypothetical protein MMC11_001171 [Xylographa trunciseda]|nr:hypothetical protein [Xylographa trunciseda]
MATKAFPAWSKVVRLHDDTSYAYVHVTAANSKPTFLLLHGFPSSSYDWRHQISGLAAAGYGVLAPDLLGYGDTDKPVEVEKYAFKAMGQHMAGILKNEKLGKVIGVGHDWGSGLLTYMGVYQPELFLALVFLSAGYVDPGTIYAIDAMNAGTEKAFGYPCFGYWPLFGSTEGADLLDQHAGALTSLFYPAEPESWKKDLGPLNAARSWIVADTKAPLPSWLPQEQAATHESIMTHGGYTGPLNWYKCAMQGVNSKDASGLTDERKRIDLPTLLVVGERDAITRLEIHEAGTKARTSNLRIERLDCGHWPQLEMKEELMKVLRSFAADVADQVQSK